MNTQDQITADLLELGVRTGGVLLVHSSLRSLGPIPRGPETVIHGLLGALGKDGTLLMPSLSYETVGAHNPVFDVRNTPSCVGALPEYFRTRPHTLRSVHPTHSVCGVGRMARDLLDDHYRDTTPVGQNSPFARLRELGGQILFIGCGLRPNTMMHGVEEHVVPPYLYSEDVTYKIILGDGSETSMCVRSHNFKGWIQRYDRLEGEMHYGLHKGTVLQAECYLLEAAEAWFAALSRMRKESLFFVDKAQPADADQLA